MNTNIIEERKIFTTISLRINAKNMKFTYFKITQEICHYRVSNIYHETFLVLFSFAFCTYVRVSKMYEGAYCIGERTCPDKRNLNCPTTGSSASCGGEDPEGRLALTGSELCFSAQFARPTLIIRGEGLPPGRSPASSRSAGVERLSLKKRPYKQRNARAN